MKKSYVQPYQELIKKVVVAANTGTNAVVDVGNLLQGADIISASIEVTTAFASGTTIDLGVDSQTNLLLDNQAISAVGNFKSTVQKELTKSEGLCLTFSQASSTGAAIVRIVYFLPTQEARDY
jgi:hypothetical protein